MWLILRLAFRNLLRNKRRSTLTLLAVLIPVALLDLVWGVTGALERGLFENTVRLDTGHLQIHKAGYRVIGQAVPLIRDVGPVLDALKQEPEISAFTVRLELPALASSGSRSRGVLLQGVDPESSQRVSVIDRWVHEGRYLKPGDERTAVIGRGLLKKLGLDLGGRVILLIAHPDTGTGVLLPEIVGILDAPSRELSRAIVQVPLREARKAIRLPNGATSVIALVQGVQGPWDTPRIQAVAERLQLALGEEFTVETWEELAPQAVGFLKILKPINAGFMAIFFALAGLVVLNTLYLNVLERRHELGVILAVGAGQRRVLAMITTEALVLAGMGALVGSLLGIGLVAHWSRGLVLPTVYKEVYAQIGMEPVLYLSMTAGEAVLCAVAMLAVAWLAAWLPARHAAKLEPVEAIRAAAA
jgi:ABC-type lipoprotein release transport system permease subunit